MSDIKLFQFNATTVDEIPARCAPVEKYLQNLLEKHLAKLLGVRFLASEHGTGKNQRGHIDSLGLDENNCPVIIEYKRKANENIITQGLYYLDWLLDHQGDFILLAQRKLGIEATLNIEFSGTRLICVAAEFSRYDERAVAQINHCIELIRYSLFGENLLLLERLNTAITPFMETSENVDSVGKSATPQGVGMAMPMRMRLSSMNSDVEKIYLALLDFVENLGEDVTIKFLKHYIALSRIRNFTSIQPAKNTIKIYLNLDPDEILPEDGFSRDVRTIGHHSSGNLEIDLRSQSDLDRSKPLIELAYQRN